MAQPSHCSGWQVLNVPRSSLKAVFDQKLRAVCFFHRFPVRPSGAKPEQQPHSVLLFMSLLSLSPATIDYV